ncbi:MAG: phosphoribosyltransferase [Robiginitomaculum sp.]|nr:MAG: phosphoribosyltransferase [Robiginitomaculum sp.]
MRTLYGHLLDTLLPPHSLITGQVLSKAGPEADVELWQNLKFIDDPCCQACGFPFEFEQGQNALCIRCTAYKPEFDQARSAITYDDTSRKLVLDFKYGGRTDGLGFFAAQMVRAGAEMLDRADMLIPVPLHRARLRQRRFNQAALLAREISRITNIPYDTEILMRKKNTPIQGSLSFKARRRNVSGAFDIYGKNKHRLKNKRVVIIDDVYTTGSTLSACAKPLKRAGVAQIDALTFMRVVRPLEIPLELLAHSLKKDEPTQKETS